MATGIQTGMRTGSGPLAAGRGPMGKPPGGGGLGKVTAFWGGLSPKMRTMIMGLVAVVVLGGLAYLAISSSNAPQPLYAYKLNEEDARDISLLLQEKGIYNQIPVTNDNVLVRPADKSRALLHVGAAGLPHHPVLTPWNDTSAGAFSTETETEKKARMQRQLEGELTEALRQMEGVADAYVKLVVPETSYFQDDSGSQAKAMVMLKLEPNHQVSRDQVMTIVNLVSHSVPQLKPENVAVLNTEKQDLTANLPTANNPVAATGSQLEYQMAYEKGTREKVQRMLDSVLGPNRAVVELSAEFDWSQMEQTREVVGGPADGGSVVTAVREQEEVYNKQQGQDGEQGAQMSGGTEGSGKAGGYRQVKREKAVATNKSTTHTVVTTPRRKRVTCSVAVDNLKPDQIEKIAGLVQDAIGADPAQGDSVTVRSMPFARNEMNELTSSMIEQMNQGAAPRAPRANPLGSPQMMAAMMFLPALLLLAVVAIFLLRQRQVQVDQAQLVLGTSSGATASDIADLLNEKSGKSKAMGETRVNTTDQLEKLAKERPTKVAELLKSTWLSQGGGQ